MRLLQEVVAKNFKKNAKPELGLHHITGNNFISEMCERGVLKQGFSLSCSRCHNEGWYSIEDVGDHWKCRFCGNQARTTALSDRTNLSFKVDGLLQIHGNAQGAFTNILVLWLFNHFGNFSTSMNYIPSFILKEDKKKEPLLECDLLISLESRRRSTGDTILVESKSENRLQEKDIAQIRKLNELMGLNSFLCFATLRDSFDASEIKLLEQLYTENKRLILLTKKEFCRYDLRVEEDFPAFKDIEKYIFDLECLSMATVQKHLNPAKLEDIRMHMW